MPVQAQESARRFERRLHRRYGGFTVGVLAFVGLLAVLEQQGLARAWIGTLFLMATVAVYATIGLLCRTTDEAEYYVAGRRVPALYNGMATAADWVSAASFIGMAGVIFLQGYGGLAYVLGWTGGYCLIALLLAPYLRRFGHYTLPDFIGARFGGPARVIAVVCVVLVSFVYLVVQIYGVGLITSHLTGFSFEVGIFVGLGGVLVCSFLGGMWAVTWTQVAQYIVLLIALTVPVLWMSFTSTGGVLPGWSYRTQLDSVIEIEGRLRTDPAELSAIAAWQAKAEVAQRKLQDVPAARLADAERLQAEARRLRDEDGPLASVQRAERALARSPRSDDAARAAYQAERNRALDQARPLGTIAPQVQAFPEGGEGLASRRNFLALVFCLMLGTAAMPHVLTRCYTTPSAGAARRSVSWTLLFIVLLYLSAPALAVLVKHELLSSLIGTPLDSLPGWIRRWSKLEPGLLSYEDVNGDGVLQLAELHLGGDLIVLAAPEIAGLPYVFTCLVAAGGLAAALSTADGLLLTVANALAHDLYFRAGREQTSPIRRVMVSKMLVLLVALAAAWVASLRVAGILPFVTAAFSIAASAFFPALVLRVFWRRASATGAVLGMLAGALVCTGYMAAHLPLFRSWWTSEPPRWFGIDPVAAGVFGVPAGFFVIWLASRLGHPPSPAQAAMVDALRTPSRR